MKLQEISRQMPFDIDTLHERRWSLASKQPRLLSRPITTITRITTITEDEKEIMIMCTASELNSTVNDLLELRRMKEALEAEITAAEDKLKAHMNETGIYEIDALNAKVTWNSVTSTRIDTTAMKKELPDLCARYTKTSTVRRFCVVG